MKKLPVTTVQPNSKIKKSGLYDLTLSQYHSDCAWLPSASSSDLKLIADSGEEYYADSYYNEENNDEKARVKLHAEHFRFGTAAHAKILEPQKWINNYIMRPTKWNTWRTADSKHWRWVQEYQKGMTVITKEDISRVDAMARRIADDPICSILFDTGIPEVSMFLETEFGVVMKSRPDMMSLRQDKKTKKVFLADNVLTDYKTTYDNSVGNCYRDIAKYGYDMKLANAALMVCRLFNIDFGTLDFCLVFQKTVKPFGITPIELDNEYMFKLAAKNLYAAKLFAEGMAPMGQWQGYSGDIIKYRPNGFYVERMEQFIQDGTYPNLDSKMRIVKS